MATRSPAVTLFLDPLSYHLEADRLFDPANTPNSGERILEPYAYLRALLAERGIATHTGDMLLSGAVRPSELNLYATLGIRSRYRALAARGDTVLSAFFVNECPVAEPRIFAELPEAHAHFRRLYSYASDEAMRPFVSEPLHFLPFRYPYPFDAVHEQAWARAERGFLTIINGNKRPRLQTAELYSERMRAVAHFERYGEIDLYGVGWDGPPYRIGETRTPHALRRVAYLAERRWDRLRRERDPLLAAARRAWRGSVASKSETLSGYTFALCFENMVHQGWVTEKIFDCLAAGTIPIYLGAPDVEDWVDPACYVDMRRFAGFEELRSFLRALGPAEIAGYREAGRAYFGSARFRPFTKQAFAEVVSDFVAEDAGIAP